MPPLYGSPSCHFDVRFPGHAVRVDDARHAVTHQGAKDFLALSREAGPRNVATTGQSIWMGKIMGKHWIFMDIWEYHWDILGYTISINIWYLLILDGTKQQSNMANWEIPCRFIAGKSSTIMFILLVQFLPYGDETKLWCKWRLIPQIWCVYLEYV